MYVFAYRPLKTANDEPRIINTTEEYAATFAETVGKDWIYFFVELVSPEL